MITIDYLKTICETQWNWNHIFGAIKDVYLDKGFKSKSDNFFRSRIVERCFSVFSELIHIDEDGIDFELIVDGKTIFIEGKFGKGYLLKKGGTTNIKMKNYFGDITNETFEKFKSQTKLDYVMIVDTKYYTAALATRETAQKYYFTSGDGVKTRIPKDELVYLDLDVSNFTFPSSSIKISKELNEFIDNWIKDR
jgi:hypothetical protein